jgi:hypothetical protein
LVRSGSNEAERVANVEGPSLTEDGHNEATETEADERVL